MLIPSLAILREGIVCVKIESLNGCFKTLRNVNSLKELINLEKQSIERNHERTSLSDN